MAISVVAMVGSLSLSQRWVVVIAFGVAMWVIVGLLLGSDGPSDGHWFVYTEGDGVVTSGDSRHDVRRGLITLGAVALWAIGSVRLLAPSLGSTHDE